MAKNIVKNNNKNPLVSVVMSVYNGEKYLREAVDSILNQTFRDFEFIIINDGSTDNTLKILKTYRDPRIVLISRKNKGLVESLNEGIKKAKGKYIARQDADDISIKDRLRKQVDFIVSNTGTVLVGSSMVIKYNNKLVNHYVLLGDTELRAEMLVRCPFVHGSTMYRKKAAIEAGLYDYKYWPAEDYEFWIRLSKTGGIANIYEPLYIYRDNNLGISNLNSKNQKSKANEIIKLAFADIDSHLKGKVNFLKYYKYKSGEILIHRISDIYKNIKNNEFSYENKTRYIKGIIFKTKFYIIVYKLYKKFNYWKLV